MTGRSLPVLHVRIPFNEQMQLVAFGVEATVAVARVVGRRM
jgi:hypothetical protein